MRVPKNPTLIGSAQAAAAFGVDRATFNRWVQSGRIPVAAKPLDGATSARLFDAAVITKLAASYEHPRKDRAS